MDPKLDEPIVIAEGDQHDQAEAGRENSQQARRSQCQLKRAADVGGGMHRALRKKDLC